MAQLTVNEDGHIVITDQEQSLVYTGTTVSLSDGRIIRHESRGGEMTSVASASVGSVYVEISHLGHGPKGGELVLVATFTDGSTAVALGGLVVDEIPEVVEESWPAAVDLALGLITDATVDSGTKEEIEDFHQRLLAVLYG
ncbi:MAG: hypothetical protein E6Q27_03405 [Aeromicrobium sp.]|nr:MAG: hypothetical protein E6Q27_03405 [Aeromicrobium sp.]